MDRAHGSPVIPVGGGNPDPVGGATPHQRIAGLQREINLDQSFQSRASLAAEEGAAQAAHVCLTGMKVGITAVGRSLGH